LERVFVGELGDGGTDCQATAVRHRVTRVDGEIREGVLELLGVARDDGRLAVTLEIESDVRAKNAAEQCLDISHDLVEINRLDAKHLAAAECDEPLGQRGGSLDG
jgi:hypothetical protein